MLKDGRYEEIFESYSKIWRDASQAEFEKALESQTQTASDQLQQQHLSVLSFSKLGAHSSSTSNHFLSAKALGRLPQEEVRLYNDISSQSAIEQFKGRMQKPG